MSTTPPPKRPGPPATLPPPDDFDEEAPTSVAPGKPRADMPHEFDEGGELDQTGDEPVTSVAVEGGRKPKPAHDPDDDTAPTKDV